MTLAQGNVALAFGITFAAGAATMVGASVVFFPKLVKLASRRVLAGSLGFSAGVMIYISFVDIFQKAVDAFMDSGMGENRAFGFSTLYLFLGILIMKVSIHLDDVNFFWEGKNIKHFILCYTPSGC